LGVEKNVIEVDSLTDVVFLGDLKSLSESGVSGGDDG